MSASLKLYSRADAAYEIAGFRANRGKASRLKANERILARLAELQTQAAKASEVTVQSLLNELEAAREKASDLDQLSAAVRAIEAKAKVSGIMIQRVEVGSPGSFADLDSVEDIVSAMIEGYGKEGYQFTPDQRGEFTEILSGWAQAANDFLASCRPMKAVEGTSPADIRDREHRVNMRKRVPRLIAGPH